MTCAGEKQPISSHLYGSGSAHRLLSSLPQSLRRAQLGHLQMWPSLFPISLLALATLQMSADGSKLMVFWLRPHRAVRSVTIGRPRT